MGKNMLLIGLMVAALSGCVRTSTGTNSATPAPTDAPASTVEATEATSAPAAPAAAEMETAAETAGSIEIRDLWVRATVGTVAPGSGQGQGNRPGQGQGQGQGNRPGQGQGQGNRPGQGQGGSGATMDSTTSSAFMTIVNTGNTVDALVEVATDAAETVELATMEPAQQQAAVEQIEVPAGEEVVLDQGPGYHIFLSDLTRDLAVGDTVELTLTFEHAGEIAVTAPVQAPTPGQGRP
jgi:hypothetical protein